MRLIAIDGSPAGGGRTERVLTQMLLAAAEAGAETRLLSLASVGTSPSVADELFGYDAFIIGSPVHRGSYSGTLKSFLDVLPRGMWGETDRPITGRAASIVLTGATHHHYLAMNDLRDVLAGFFAAHVLSPGVYVPSAGFDDDKNLVDPYCTFARRQAVALTDLAAAVSQYPSLSSVRPQA